MNDRIGSGGSEFLIRTYHRNGRGLVEVVHMSPTGREYSFVATAGPATLLARALAKAAEELAAEKPVPLSAPPAAVPRASALGVVHAPGRPRGKVAP